MTGNVIYLIVIAFWCRSLPELPRGVVVLRENLAAASHLSKFGATHASACRYIQVVLGP